MSLWNNPPFYLTAYGLAVKHGYRGSEEQWLADMHYPVGAIYLSVEDKTPALLFGGTWVRIEDKVLVTAGEKHTAGSVGGYVLTEETATLFNDEDQTAQYMVVYAWKRTK